MLKPRPYQKKVVDDAINFFNSKSKKREIIVAPTASGKSIIIAFITKELKEGVLVLQPSKELLLQNFEKFKIAGGEAKIFSASVGKKEIGDVTFATIGSIVKKPELFTHKKYIIIDECHMVTPKKNSMYMKFFDKLSKDVKYLGLTATPYRTKIQREPFTGEKYNKINLLPRERPMFFNSFLHVIQPREMYEAGYLAPVKYIELDWKGNDLKLNTTGSEYTDKSIEKALMINEVNKRLPNIIADAKRKGRKRVLVFVFVVDPAEYLAIITQNAVAISSRTKKKERERIINGFKNGDIFVVYNVSVLTTGFDYPQLDTIILARPTYSIVLYTQMVGRVSRLHDEKKYGVVLDMVGNYKRFGDVKELEVVNDNHHGWILKNERGKISAENIDWTS
jgi:DNA repair protein RadD